MSIEAKILTLSIPVLPWPLPQDNTLFRKANFLLAEIQGFYQELNKFWKEETHRVAEALKKRQTDVRDFECWDNFYSSLKLTIENWKVFYLPSNLHFSTNQSCLESATEW